MATDIDNWLSNLYFEIVTLPRQVHIPFPSDVIINICLTSLCRYLSGMSEYEVQLQLTSDLLAHSAQASDSAIVDEHDQMNDRESTCSHGGELSTVHDCSDNTSIPPQAELEAR